MYTLRDLRQWMDLAFNLSELKALSFDLGIDYDNLRGEIKREKIIALIKEAHQGQKLDELVALLATERPHPHGIDWEESARLIGALQEYDIAVAEFEGDDRLPPPFQVPPPIPHFVNRQELHELTAAIDDYDKASVRAVGMLGAGKSALANQLARQVREHFPDGVLWLQGNPRELEADLKRTAMAYGRGEHFSQLTTLDEKIDFIRSVLAGKRVLVILDGVTEGEAFARLLEIEGESFTVITTRDQMMLSNVAADAISIPPFSKQQALDYLVRVAGEARVERDFEEARRLVDMLGHLPLALSVVGGLLSESEELTIAEYNQMLAKEENHIEGLADWLTGLNHVSASFELSYQALQSPLQTLFKSLSVYGARTFSSQSAAAVSGMPLSQVKLGLGRLARLSFLQFNRDTGRYEINPLVHSFAVKKCGADFAIFDNRAAAYYLDLLQESIEAKKRVTQEEWPNISAIVSRLYQSKQWKRLVAVVLQLTHFRMGTMGLLERYGYWQEARKFLDQALEAPSDVVDAEQAILLRLNAAGFALLQNDSNASYPWLEEVDALLAQVFGEEISPWIRVHYSELRAKTLLQTDPAQALAELQRCQQALLIVAPGNYRAQRGYLAARMVPIYGRMGRLDDAAKSAAEALELLPSEPSMAHIKLGQNLFLIHRLQGNLDESMAALDRALAFAEELSAVDALPGLWSSIGWNLQQLGRLREAVTQFTRARSLAQHMGNVFQACGDTLNLGRVYLVLGEELLAEKLLEDALTVAENHQLRNVEALVLSNIVDLQIAIGTTEGANDKLSQAMDIAEQLDVGYLKPTLLRQRAQLYLLDTNYGEAEALIDQAIEMAEKYRDVEEVGVSYRVKGQILSRHGRKDEATSSFSESEKILSDLSEYERARTGLTLVKHLGAQTEGNEELRQLAEGAKRVFANMGARRDLAEANEVLRSL